MFAGAAFTDEADLAVDVEVVNTLVGLGVIEGYTDGSFRPNDTVTRAEMAKMIYVVRTGQSDAKAYNEDTTSFTDISNHWGRGYIKYAQSLGIIAGKNATTFAPDETVTTQEAAKMLLVTLGYNAEKAGLVGANWGNRTTALADENGLLKDVNNGTTAGLPRQYAAQLIYNAIFTATVVLRDGEYTNYNLTGTEKLPTIGVRYMDLSEKDGMLLDLSYNSDKKEYTYTVGGVSFTTTADYSSLYGMNVNVLYKTVNKKTTVYGMYAQDSSVIVESTAGKIDKLTDIAVGTTEKVKVDGTEYKLDDELTGYYFCGGKIKKISDILAMTGYESFNFKAIDNDDDDKIDTLVVYPVTVAKITYVNKTGVRVGATSYDFDDANIYEGAKKDDWAVITEAKYTANDEAVLVKADVVSGKVTSVKSASDNKTTEVRVDGNWYKSAVANDSTAISNKVDLVVYNGVYFDVDGSSTSLDVAVVTGVGNYDGMDDVLKVRLMFKDGKEEVVDVEKWGDDVTKDTDKDADVMVSYEIDDDKYTLTTVAANQIGSSDYTGVLSLDGYDKDKAAVTKDDTEYDVADDAMVVIKNADDKYVFMTGAALVARNSFNFTTSYAAVDGSEIGALFAVTSSTVTSGDKMYGYIVDTNVALNDDDKEKLFIDVIVDGEKLENVETDKKTVGDYKVGTVISYTMDGDVMSVTEETTAVAAAIKEFNASRVLFYGADDTTTRKLLTKDTIIIAIDSDDADNVLYAGNSLVAANASAFEGENGAASAYYKNALYIPDGDDIEVIFVEVASDAEFKVAVQN